MPVVLRLTFPAGRYHATPWGRHVNEGVAEWPPSPWRLLRAVVAVWKRTCPDVPTEQVQRLLTPLCQPPLFHLPPHRVAHTRHYMPWEKKGPADRTLVFDTFVVVNRKDELFVGWPDAALAAEDEACLRRLVGNLTSLGRAEGWVEAAVESFPDRMPEWNCVPTAADPNPVRVLCPDPATAFDDTHYPKVGRTTKPKDRLFDCPPWHLCLDTETLHAERWPSVPGSVWVNYTRPAEKAAPPPPAPKRDGPTAVRLLLDGPVLPLAVDAVAVAEGVRRAVMSQFNHWCRRQPAEAVARFRRPDSDRFRSDVLSGKDAGGAMLLRSHAHAYYLPTADGRRVTHVTVTAAGGFGPEEVAAVAAVRTVRIGFGDKELKVAVQLIGLGTVEQIADDLSRPAAAWESVTPFVGPTHIGQHGRDRYLRKAVRREAKRWADERGLPTPTVESLTDQPGDIPSREYRRSRARDGGGGFGRPCGRFRLTFPQPVSGPLALGYAAHFGLGLFRPVGG